MNDHDHDRHEHDHPDRDRHDRDHQAHGRHEHDRHEHDQHERESAAHGHHDRESDDRPPSQQRCCCHHDGRSQASGDRDDHRHAHEGCCCDGGHAVGRPGDVGNPNRPGKTVGTSRGRFKDPRGLQPGDLSTKNPADSWAGSREELYLPYLFLRANPGDLGARPVVGPFWESPDVFILAGVDAAVAPAIPPALGQTGLAGQPNTLYAHVWNFGNASAPQVVVEFYWCDPTLGIGPASAHLIGQAMVSLGAKGSGQSHAVVKCPESWTPTYVNGGHECLVVRVWDYTGDALGTPPWDASLNRHVGQRNIHVVPPGGSLGAALAHGALQNNAGPLLLRVGPLYGEPAQVTVARVAPHEMPWLQLHTGERGKFPAQATPTGAALLSRPTTVGGGTPSGGLGGVQHVAGEDHQVALTTTDDPPGPGEAHVYRVTASQGGQVVGGYTVVRLG
jgi:hypothetical protein